MVSVHIKHSEVPDQIVRRSKLETECMLIRLKVEFNFLGIIQIRQTIVQKTASSLIFFPFPCNLTQIIFFLVSGVFTL